MVALTWSSRAAANRIASASGPSGLAAPESSTCRMISAPGEPPGSRVSTTADAHRPQALRQQRGLRRLAGSLAALEGDESSAHAAMSRELCWAVLPLAAGLIEQEEAAGAISQLLDARTEQADHELGGGVEGALGHISGSRRLRRPAAALRAPGHRRATPSTCRSAGPARPAPAPGRNRPRAR